MDTKILPKELLLAAPRLLTVAVAGKAGHCVSVQENYNLRLQGMRSPRMQRCIASTRPWSNDRRQASFHSKMQSAGISRLWWEAGHPLDHTRRFASSAQEEKKPTMEAKLRKLYMRVHPDLFSSFPNARKANEQSFQKLTEFIDSFNPSTTPSQPKAVPLEFYMRPVDHKAEFEYELEHVQVTVRSGGSQREKFVQMGKLFEACGLGKDFMMTESVLGGKMSSLESFFAQVGAKAVSNKVAMDRAWREVYTHQHALHLHHNVRVAFSESSEPAVRVCLLKQLLSDDVIEAINSIEHDSRQFVVSEQNGIDHEGRITLDRACEPQHWAQHIASLDWAKSLQAKDRVRQLRSFEKNASRGLGLSFIHASREVEHTAQYADLLYGILGKMDSQHHTLNECDAKGNGLSSKAVMMVQKSVDDCWEIMPGFGIETSKGLLLTSVECDQGDIIDFARTYGFEAARHRRNFDKQREELSTLLVQTKQALGLTMLDVDWSGVSHQEAIACCARLMDNAGSLSPPTGLSPLVNGMHVRIGQDFELRDHVIVVPHNFQWDG